MLNCKQASELASQSLDKPLPWSKRWQLKLHLVICAMCRQFVKQLQLIRKASEQWQQQVESDESIKLPEHVKQTIQTKLKDH